MNMKNLPVIISNTFYGILVCGSMWDNIKRITFGIRNGEASLSDPITLTGFIFKDVSWIMLLVWILFWLVLLLIKKLRYWNIERKKKKEAKQKELFMSWIDEYFNKG
jgi:hypothetical protein